MYGTQNHRFRSHPHGKSKSKSHLCGPWWLICVRWFPNLVGNSTTQKQKSPFSTISQLSWPLPGEDSLSQIGRSQGVLFCGDEWKATDLVQRRLLRQVGGSGGLRTRKQLSLIVAHPAARCGQGGDGHEDDECAGREVPPPVVVTQDPSAYCLSYDWLSSHRAGWLMVLWSSISWTEHRSEVGHYA